MQFDEQDTELNKSKRNSCVKNILNPIVSCTISSICRLRFDTAVRSPSQRYSSVKFMYAMWHAFNIQINILPVYYYCKCTLVVHIPRREWFRRHTHALAEIHLINYITKWQCAIKMKAIILRSSMQLYLQLTIYLLITLLIHALLTIRYYCY